jgi:hypothetical protein
MSGMWRLVKYLVKVASLAALVLLASRNLKYVLLGLPFGFLGG